MAKAWLSVLSGALLVTGVIACGGSDSDQSPTPTVPIQSTKPIKIPKLNERQEAEAIRIAKQDPAFRQITDGHNPTFKAVGVWTRTNNEFLGAGIQVEFETAGSYEDEQWPSIENRDALYGEYHGEGEPGPVEPGVRPEIGTASVTATDVDRIVVMVDLNSKSVAEITPM